VLPVDGTYTIVATRFERTEGDTVGPYQLQLDSSGNAFTNVAQSTTRIEYGDTVQGVITDTTEQVVYAFVAQPGDQLTITMDRADGNLDARVVVLNSSQRQVGTDDDGGEGQNSLLNLSITEGGVYYLVATRFSGTDGDPNTTGGYSLSLTEAGSAAGGEADSDQPAEIDQPLEIDSP
jgi:hypothetical protein